MAIWRLRTKRSISADGETTAVCAIPPPSERRVRVIKNRYIDFTSFSLQNICHWRFAIYPVWSLQYQLASPCDVEQLAKVELYSKPLNVLNRCRKNGGR